MHYLVVLKNASLIHYENVSAFKAVVSRSGISHYLKFHLYPSLWGTYPVNAQNTLWVYSPSWAGAGAFFIYIFLFVSVYIPSFLLSVNIYLVPAMG